MKRRTRKIIYFFTVTVFVTALWLPLLNDMFCLIPVEETFGKWENRNPAPEAYLNIGNLSPFSQEFENFYNDNFTFRQLCLKSYIYIKYVLLGQSPFPSKVIIGKKGWLYEGAAERNMYEGKTRISNDTLKIIADELHCRAVKYKEKNIRFYVAFAPTKYMIYPEYLPDYIEQRPDFSAPLIEMLNKDTLISFIDLNAILKENKNKGTLYHQTDNHWNMLGGLYAVKKITETINKDIPSVSTLDPLMYIIDSSKNNIGNLSYMTGMKYYFTNNDIEVKPSFEKRSHAAPKANYQMPMWFPYPEQFEIVSRIDSTGLPKLLVIRDSFADAVMPFLNEHFGKVVYIFDSWKYQMNEAIVENEKPDAVLLLIFVPHVANIVKNCDCNVPVNP